MAYKKSKYDAECHYKGKLVGRCIPDRVKDKAAFEENINKSLREYHPEYWRSRQQGFERAAPRPERTATRDAER